MPKRVGLFGGAFDPPHIGHLRAAMRAKDMGGLDEIWFLPCYSDAFGKKNLSDFYHRAKMIEIMINNIPSFRICAREEKLKNMAGTYAVVRSLKESFPDIDFSYIIGVDQGDIIHKWKNSRRLRREIKFIVLNRAGYTPWKSWYRKAPHKFYSTNTTDILVSSSWIRSRLSVKVGLKVREALLLYLGRVLKYIEDNNLYK